MSEIRDLIAVLGAIDEQFPTLGEDLRAQIAGLVPAYRQPSRVRWFERFTGALEREFPGIDAAMDGLARRRDEAENLYISLLPRRVLAVALAARVFPQFGPGGSQVGWSLDILEAPGILQSRPELPKRHRPHERGPGLGRAQRRLQRRRPADDESRSQAMALLAALVDANQLRTIEQWHPFLESLDGIVHPQLLSVPAPCAGTVVEPGPTSGPRETALLRTSVCVKDVKIGDVATFLNPHDWDECSPWWCEMRQVTPPQNLGANHELFYERVAVPCDHPLFEVSAFLDFVRPIDDPNRKVLVYKLHGDGAQTIGQQTANGMVDVDRGVIELRQESDHVHVDTTKRIRFTNESIDSDVVAMLVCWVGYGDVATDLICDCASGTPQEIDCETTEPAFGPLDRFRELAMACKADAGAEARRLAERMGGEYGLDAAVEDAGRAVTLAVQSWKKVTTTWLHAAADMAGTAAPQETSTALARTFSFPGVLQERYALAFSPLDPLVSPYGEPGQPAIAIEPAEVGPENPDFRLVARDTSQLEGTVYLGTVVALPGGPERPSVRVDVIVP